MRASSIPVKPLGIGVAVGRGVGNTTAGGKAIGVAVGAGVAVGNGVGNTNADGVAVGSGLGIENGVAVGAGVAVGNGVGKIIGAGVAVGSGLGIENGVAVGSGVGKTIGVAVGAGVAVGNGVGNTTSEQATTITDDTEAANSNNILSFMRPSLLLNGINNHCDGQQHASHHRVNPKHNSHTLR